tara:strand:+ start:473 stop:646 length:174 start_codon:yes stop_codon:yes gene_type:complete
MTININKEMLEYLIQLVEIDKEKLKENMQLDILENDEKELKMLEDLYKILILKNKQN